MLSDVLDYPNWSQVLPTYRTPQKTLRMFQNFLNTSPDIARTVKKLRLVCYPGLLVLREFTPRALLTLYVDADDCDTSLFSSTLSKLPHLRELSLVDVVLKQSSFLSQYKNLARPLPSLQTFSIHYANRRGNRAEHLHDFAEDSYVMALLTCFAAIDELHVSNFGNAQRPANSSETALGVESYVTECNPQTAVKSFTYTASHPRDVFAFLLKTPSSGTLEKLDFSDAPWTMPKQRFLDDIGGSWTHLCIPVPQSPLHEQPGDYGESLYTKISRSC